MGGTQSLAEECPPHLIPSASLEWVEHRHRQELAKLGMEIAVLRQQLLDAGLEPKTKTGQEWLDMFRSCSKVMRIAHDALANLGSSKELLQDSWCE